MTAEELFDLPDDGWRHALVGDTRPEVAAKVASWLAAGTRAAWVVDPGRRSVAVHEPGAAPRRLAGAGVVDGAPLFPGFRLPVADVFAAGAGAAGLPSP